MAKLVRIEIMDQYGKWHKYKKGFFGPSQVKQQMQVALKSKFNSKMVRVFDNKTNAMIDMLQG